MAKVNGRPTKYRPEYDQQAIEFLNQGFSLTALAGYFGVARATIYNWAEEHESFLDAIKVGEAKRSWTWEEMLINHAKTGEGNATAIIFGLKNMSAEEWKDRKAVEVGGPDGGPISVELVRFAADGDD